MSVWFANTFAVGQAPILRSVNGLFLFALSIGLIWLSRDPYNIFAITTIKDWLLVQLLTATCVFGVLDKSRVSRKYQRFDPVRVIISDLTMLAPGNIPNMVLLALTKPDEKHSLWNCRITHCT